MTSKQSTIAALLKERAGYEQRGLKDRIRAVDEALIALGHHVETASVQAAPETAALPHGRKRRKA
jgi:hypothetical protein